MNDGDDFSSLDSFLFDIFLLDEVEMISWRGDDIKESFIEEDEVKLSLYFFRVSFIESFPFINGECT